MNPSICAAAGTRPLQIGRASRFECLSARQQYRVALHGCWGDGAPSAFRHRAAPVPPLNGCHLLTRMGRCDIAQGSEEHGASLRHSRAHLHFEDDIAKEAGVNLAKTLAKRGYHIDIKKL